MMGSPCLSPGAALLPFRSCIKKKPGLVKAVLWFMLSASVSQLRLGRTAAKNSCEFLRKSLMGFLCGWKERTEAAGFWGEDQADKVRVCDQLKVVWSYCPAEAGPS